MINSTLQYVNSRLSLNNDHKTDYNVKYIYGPFDSEKMKEYISFIYEWNGLTSSSKIPTTYKNYQSKARNWLNGRRSKKYSNTLFVDMIESTYNVWLFF